MAARTPRRAARRARPVGRRAARAAGRRARRCSARCCRSSAASTTSWPAPTPAGALVQFARAENATQIVLGASRQSRWTHLLRGSVINERAPSVGRHRRPRDLVRPRARRAPSASRPTALGARVAARCCRRAAASSRGRWRSSAPPLAHPRARPTLRDTLDAPERPPALPARRGRGRRARRLRARVRVRDHRVPARQLVLHAAVLRVHDRGGREPPRAR